MKKIIPFLVLVLLAGSCRFGTKDKKDNQELRIASLSKHLTEMIFALGKGNQLVAVDLSSTYPEAAKKITTVGYHRALSAEAIIAVNPDLVIHSNDIGPETVLQQLTKAGVHMQSFYGASTIDSAKLLMTELGKFFDRPVQADSLNKKLDLDIQAAREALKNKQIKDTPTVMIIHFGRANNVYFVMSGRNGTGDKMIELAGGKVVHYDAKGARQISAEAIAEANPDIIIATDFGFDQMGSMDKFISDVPGVSLTHAGKSKRIIRFEEHDLVYFGPRSGENIIKLMNLIHP